MAGMRDTEENQLVRWSRLPICEPLRLLIAGDFVFVGLNRAKDACSELAALPVDTLDDFDPLPNKSRSPVW
jgi:hypothetical protein